MHVCCASVYGVCVGVCIRAVHNNVTCMCFIVGYVLWDFTKSCYSKVRSLDARVSILLVNMSFMHNHRAHLLSLPVSVSVNSVLPHC